MKFPWYSLRVTSTQGIPLSGLLRHLTVSIQNLRSITAGLRGPAPMNWFSALAAVVSCTCWAFCRLSFWLFLQKPLGKIAVCMAHIPPSMAGCLQSTFLTFLVLLPYVLKGLVMFLVPDHPKISSGISYGAHDAVHLDSAANSCGCFLVVGIGQGQGLTVCESFTL